MIWELDLLLLVILGVTAVVALRVHDLLAAVAVLAAYSLFAALLFAGMGAVDVAFVEAALGAGVTGVLFIAAVLRTSRLEVRRPQRRNWVVAPVLGLFLALMLYTSADLPDRGDPDAPAHQHVAAVYLERSMEDTRTPNVVTAVLADYRSQDTVGETVVIFAAGLACLLILRRRSHDDG